MAFRDESIDASLVVLQDIIDLIREPLVVLSGAPVSALSILTALAIIAVARFLTRVLAQGLMRVLASRGADQGVQFAATKIIHWIGTILGLFIALTTIGVNLDAALAAMAVLLVGIGFGLQKLAENFISGLLLLIERPLKVGDFIEVEAQRGTVIDIGLRATRIVTRDGLEVVIPNGELVSKALTNFTATSSKVRIWVDIGVAYGTDLDLARRVLLEVAASEPELLRDPAPVVIHKGFGDSSIDLSLVGWISNAPEDVTTRSQLWFAIDRAFAANNIAIPFPQRDLHVKSLGPLAASMRLPDRDAPS